MGQVYTRFITPHLPSAWVTRLAPYTDYFNTATPFVIAAIVLWAVLYTYYEIDREVTREPKLTAKLRKFYLDVEPLLVPDVHDEHSYSRRRDLLILWFREVRDWISANLGEAALSHFNAIGVLLNFNVQEAFNSDHSKLIVIINKHRENLKDIIENHAWDDTTKKRKKWRIAKMF